MYFIHTIIYKQEALDSFLKGELFTQDRESPEECTPNLQDEIDREGTCKRLLLVIKWGGFPLMA